MTQRPKPSDAPVANASRAFNEIAEDVSQIASDYNLHQQSPEPEHREFNTTLDHVRKGGEGRRLKQTDNGAQQSSFSHASSKAQYTESKRNHPTDFVVVRKPSGSQAENGGGER